MSQRKRIIFFLLIGLLTVAVAVIPDLVSDELKSWCLQHLGPSYPWYLVETERIMGKMDLVGVV